MEALEQAKAQNFMGKRARTQALEDKGIAQTQILVLKEERAKDRDCF